MGISKNSGFTPKSSILIGFSSINHPFGGTFIFGNTHISSYQLALGSDLGAGGVPKKSLYSREPRSCSMAGIRLIFPIPVVKWDLNCYK